MLILPSHLAQAPAPVSDSHFMASAMQLWSNWHQGAESFLVHSSGSTGAPKPFVLHRDRILFSARRTIQQFVQHPQLPYICCLPVGGVGGAMMVFRAAVAKAPLWLIEPALNPLAELESLPAQPTALISLTPAQLLRIVSDANPTHFQWLDQADAILIGGGSLPSYESLLPFLSRWNLILTYGMTETYSHIAYCALNQAIIQSECIAFHPLPSVSISLVDSKLAISDFTTGNYTLITNDLASIHASGSFTIHGRADGVINSGGVKIVAETLEQQIRSVLAQVKPDYQHLPFIVAGLPHPLWGQELVMIASKMDGQHSIEASALLQFISSSIPQKHHHPKRLIILDSWPSTPLGKPRRAEIVQLALAKTQA